MTQLLWLIACTPRTSAAPCVRSGWSEVRKCVGVRCHEGGTRQHDSDWSGFDVYGFGTWLTDRLRDIFYVARGRWAMTLRIGFVDVRARSASSVVPSGTRK